MVIESQLSTRDRTEHIKEADEGAIDGEDMGVASSFRRFMMHVVRAQEYESPLDVGLSRE